MQFPSYYDPKRVGTLFYPDVMEIAACAHNAGLPPGDEDDETCLLLLVDMQVDFCHREGTLHTPGALEDVRRTIEFLFRHAGRITRIMCSLDTHLPHQIFHPAWWVDSDGNHPDPLTVITHDDVQSERWVPVRDRQWSVDYVRKLEGGAEKQLMIWPYHVPQGGVGHLVDPELWSAVFWHALARDTQPVWWTKGLAPRTEHYSAVRPEVIAEQQQADAGQRFLQTLGNFDHVAVAGEAASHCVLETMEDIVDAYRDDRDRLANTVLLTDCTSPVKHSDIDFAKLAEEKFAAFSEAGVRLMKSDEPLPW